MTQADFDPHHAWLGIAPEEQPADYYRLLGVARFEADRDVIRRASEERMQLLRWHKAGAQARMAQKVASQISKATSCLLNPYRKGLYDDYLRSHAHDATRAGAVWPPADSACPARADALCEAPQTGPRPAVAILPRVRRSLATKSGLAMAVAALVVAALGGSMWFFSGRDAGPNVAIAPPGTVSVDGEKSVVPVKTGTQDVRTPTQGAQSGAAMENTVVRTPPRASAGDEPPRLSPGASGGPIAAGSDSPPSNADPTPVPPTTAATGASASPRPATAASPPARADGAASTPSPDVRSPPRPRPAVIAANVKKRPPTVEEQETARRSVRDLLAAEFAAAKRASDHVDLCDRLVELARDSRDDTAAQYALYLEAREEAILGADYVKALAVTERLADAFAVDVWRLQAETFARAGDTARTSVDRKALAQLAQTVVPNLLRAGQFDAANDVAQVAISAASRARDPELGKATRQLREQISQVKRKWLEAEQVAEQLRRDPDDPNLNQRYGEFLCFERADWPSGTKHLAKSSHVPLRLAAEKDAAAPVQAEAQVEAADAWFEAAEVVERDFRSAAYARGLFWARQAAPRANGLTKVRVEGRIQELERMLAGDAKESAGKASPTTAALRSAAPAPAWRPPEGFQGLLGRLQLEGRDVGVLWKYASGLQLTDAAVAQLLRQSGLARGRVRMEFVGFLFVATPTTVNVVHNGGVRDGGQAALAVDGQVLGEVGGTKATNGLYKLELGPGEHRVQWVLAGASLGVCAVQFREASTGTPLPVYHNPALLAAMRDTPFRARINVNMIQN